MKETNFRLNDMKLEISFDTSESDKFEYNYTTDDYNLLRILLKKNIKLYFKSFKVLPPINYKFHFEDDSSNVDILASGITLQIYEYSQNMYNINEKECFINIYFDINPNSK